MRPDEAAWAGALRYVTTALARLEIPFQAAGGLAARAWGGARDLVDLDFYVPDRGLDAAARGLQDRVKRGPERVRSDHWDMTVLTLEVEGCRVELAGTDSGRYRRAGGRWSDVQVDFRGGVFRTVVGVTVPVMPRDALVAYKRELEREVDLVDLHDLTGSGGAVHQRLAVYGTLMPGEVNHHVVAPMGGTWIRGTVRGELHATGWGTTYGFPALRWHPDAGAVNVQMLTSEHLPAAWEKLDAFEGSGYRRIIVPVTTAHGVILANVYVGVGACP